MRITEKTVKDNELICHEIPVEVGKTALTLLSAKEITKTTVL